MPIRFLLALMMMLAFWACSSEPTDASRQAAASNMDSSRTDGSVGDNVQASQQDKAAMPAPPPPAIVEELGLRSTGAIAAGDADYAWMYECVEAARAGDYPGLQKFISPQKGFYFLHRPGVATSIEWLSQAVALKRFTWASLVTQYQSKKDATPFKNKPVYLVEPFKVLPEWQEASTLDLPPLASEVKGRFTYFPEQVKALVEYGFMDPSPEERKRMDEVEGLVEMELLVDWVYYYFGKVAGEWRLIGLDIARCDFSA